MVRRRRRKARKKPGMFLPSIIEALAFAVGASKMVGNSATTSFLQFDIKTGLQHSINHLTAKPGDLIVGSAIALAPTIGKKLTGIKSKKLIGPVKLI